LVAENTPQTDGQAGCLEGVLFIFSRMHNGQLYFWDCFTNVHSICTWKVMYFM